MTYNIRHGRGADGHVDLGRIADVIASFDADIVGLQEVDRGRTRSAAADQAEVLASRLGMSASFAPCITHGDGHYGIATLSRLPIAETRQLALPRNERRRSEQRCALVTRFMWPDTDASIDFVNTHLSTLFRERPAQVAAIAQDTTADETILVGDFNCTPWSPAYRVLASTMQSATGRTRTWPARWPVVPIDHIFYRGPFQVVRAGAWTGSAARSASDHLPVVAELAHRGEA